ncbi:ClpP/crotonase [Aureobasidium subglaciale]|nr:ClpP/crotonase [Aureobasidium subglaciale]
MFPLDSNVPDSEQLEGRQKCQAKVLKNVLIKYIRTSQQILHNDESGSAERKPSTPCQLTTRTSSVKSRHCRRLPQHLIPTIEATCDRRRLANYGSKNESNSYLILAVFDRVGTVQPLGLQSVIYILSGFGALRGRKVILTADDFSIRAGHADGASTEKTVYMEKLAIALKLPIVKLVDGSSGGGSVTTIRTTGFSYIPPLPSFQYVVEQLNLGIPNLGAALGPAIGLGAARAVACHFSVMAGDIGSLFNAGPDVVKNASFEEDLTPADLGGPGVHCTNGTIDNLAADEAGCFEQLRTVLSYLPNCGTMLPPVVEPSDPTTRRSALLRSIIPRARNRMYNARKIITEVVDLDSFFEIGALWGRTAIVGLARLGGKPVGIVSLDCEVNAGALDALGSQKIARMLKFLDIFNIPLVQFVDIPGYAIGTVAERNATMRHGISLATAYYSTTMPVFSIITRRVYGVAGGLMLDCRDPRMRVAWPSGNWGSLPLEGGIEVGHSFELREIERQYGKQKRDERYAELESEYKRLMNPIRTANHFGVEEIIDPACTREICCEWIGHVYESLLPQRILERISGKLQPKFT